MKNGYNLITIACEDEWKIAFYINKRLFEYTVISFRLINAPTLFQEMMDTIFVDIKGVI